MLVSGRGLASLTIAVTVLTCGLGRALDLDLDKSGAQLFAANCTTCHHSPRGLAKKRFSWTLQNFLQQHYTTSTALAQTLTAYLQSIDAPRSKPQSAVHKWRSSKTNAATSPFVDTEAIDLGCRERWNCGLRLVTKPCSPDVFSQRSIKTRQRPAVSLRQRQASAANAPDPPDARSPPPGYVAGRG